MSKPKILLCSDDMNLPSGVGSMSKSIVENTLNDIQWVQMGGSNNHPFHGKYKDMDNGVRIYGAEKYGDAQLFREIIKKEDPDGVLFFTDPRHFQEHFKCEYELRKNIPFMYYNIWDNYPIPHYNHPYYKSSDGLFCISRVTESIVHGVLDKEEKENKIIDYIPHGIDENMFVPLDRNDIPKKKWLDIFEFDPTEYQFVVLWSNKNMERKRPMDIMMAFDNFIDDYHLYEYDACLIMHTNPKAKSGTDLYRFKYDHIKNQDNIYFSNNGKLDRKDMKYLYNVSDVVVNNSDNEGWGLAVTEALMCGRPVIASSIGGIQDQLGYKWNDGYYDTATWGEWAFPIEPDSNNLIGNNVTPYIYESRSSINQLKNNLHKAFNHSYLELSKMGKKGREFCIDQGYTSENMALQIKESIFKTLDNFEPRESIKITKL